MKTNEEIKKHIEEEELLPILSLSGGKDSLAAALLMRELGVDCGYVYADTGWEADETYEYLDYLDRYYCIAPVRQYITGIHISTFRSER